MNDPFDPIEDKEIQELKELLDRISQKYINDAGKNFVAQMIGIRRLISSQSSANQAMMNAQEAGHREMLDEQRSLVKWQKVATIATGLMVIITALYAYETRAIVASNNRMAAAAQEQVDLMKQQMRETGRPRLFVDLSESNSYGRFDGLPAEGFSFQFVVVNKSVPAAYNIRCDVRVLKDGKQIWAHRAGCRDTLVTDYQDILGVAISKDHLRSIMAPSKNGFSGIEAHVLYENSSKGGAKYSAVRIVQVVGISPNDFYLKSVSFQSN